MNDLMKMKNNLIQNFYIIGLSPEDLFQNESREKKNQKFIDIFNINNETYFIPKIISKFPPTNDNHNSIPNDIIIDHCFPKGLKIIKSQSQKIEHFSFELDNLKYTYLTKNQSIYSKIYFTCLQFYESFQEYEKLKLELNNFNNENNNINNDNSINDGNMYYIPKVICFASLLPFTKELNKILNNLYDYFIYYNSKMNTNNNAINTIINNLSPIEKVVEQIVMCLPFPLSIKNEVNISYKFNYPINSSPTVSNSINYLKNNLRASLNVNNNFPYNNTKITFPKYNPLNCYINDLYNVSLNNLFFYFNEEEVIKVFKYIMLEVPILFFSENVELLSQMIQGFLSLTQPFTYVQPYVTVLPSKFYGIINTESKFIFGIEEKYSFDFFKNNNIILDKTMIIVHFLNRKSKIEEIKKIEDHKDYVIIDNYNYFNFINNESFLPNGSKIDIISIDFPVKPKKKLLNKIKTLLSESKKKKENNLSGEFILLFNQKMRNLFYRFFTNILIGYTDYLLKMNLGNNNTNGFYYGDNIRFKINYNNNLNNYYQNSHIIFIKSVFNMDEFISKFPKDNHMFYRAFFNTKLFHNFIREIIFSKDEHIYLNHKFFDLITFIKKHKELKKQNKYKDFFLTFKNIFKKKNDKKEEKLENNTILNILNDSNFNLDEKTIMSDRNKQKNALYNYSQLITMTNTNTNTLNQNQIIINNNNIFNQQVYTKYYIFPKMLFDNEFFDIKYDKLFYRHYLEMPNHIKLDNFYKELKKLNVYYWNKFKEILFPKNPQIESPITHRVSVDLRQSSKLDLYDHNNNNRNNNENINQDLLVEHYIEYNWLLLISCSLWYCCNPIETKLRINKIFDVLEKIDFIEEQVLFFLYMAIYKFGNKSQFIKMFEFLNRFMGYSSYINLVFLCLKINKKEIDISNDSNEEEKMNFKTRSFFDENENEITEENKNINNGNKIKIGEKINTHTHINSNSNIGDNNKEEEIIFYTTQKCPKCQKENKIGNIAPMIRHRISEKRDNLYFKCSECGEDNLDIKIEYNLSIKNKKKNESKVVSKGRFKLIPPHIIYQKMKEYFIYLNDYKLEIDHIFSNDNIHLLNNIFYFSERMLPFDFLIPYEGQIDRESFMEEDEDEEDDENNDIINTKEKIQIYSINNNNFSFLGKD